MKGQTALALAGVLVVASCGSGSQSTTTVAGDSTTTTAGTTAPTTTTTTSAPSTTAPPIVETNRFGVPFTMPRPEGWGFSETGDFVVEITAGASKYLVFTTAGSPDIAGWSAKLTGDPNMTVTEPSETQIGSAVGVVLDVELAEGASAGPFCEEPCAELFAAAPTPDANYGWSLYAGFRDRVWLVDVGGEVVAVFAEAPIGQFDEFIVGVEAALAGLVWSG